VRNPFDVAASIKSTWKISIAELAGSPLTQHSFDLLLGLPLMTAACRSPKLGEMIIRYEELAAQPEETLRTITRFLGLPFEPAMTKLDPAGATMEAQRRLGSGDRKILRTKSVHTTSVGSWEKTLDEKELKILARIISPEIMVRLGYQTSVTALEKRGIRLQPEAACRDYRQHALHPTSSKSTAGLALQIRHLTKLATHHEADATARLNHVNQLTALLKTTQVELANRTAQVEQLTALVKSHESESAKRATQIATLDALLKSAQADATARLAQVQQLTAELKASAKDATARADQIKQLTALVKSHESESAKRATQIATLDALLKTAQADATARADQVKQLTALVKSHEAESTKRATQIATLDALLKSAQADATARLAQVQQLTAELKASAKDATARADQIDKLTALVKSYESDNTSLRGQIASYAQWLKDAQSDNQALIAAHRGAEMTALAALKELEQLKHSRQSGG
jgi:DNA repair exonuclease SbcCD ATPase subunit